MKHETEKKILADVLTPTVLGLQDSYKVLHILSILCFNLLLPITHDWLITYIITYWGDLEKW